VDEPALSELSGRIEQVSDRLEVVAFRKPAPVKRLGIFSPTYAVEVRDKVTGYRFIVSSEELIERGMTEASRIQRAGFAASRLRLAALLLAAVVLIFLSTPRVLTALGWLPALVLFLFALVGAWLLWRRARRMQPKELPGWGEQIRMLIRPGSTEPRSRT
jgi:Flp pilus assembly protein TadB